MIRIQAAAFQMGSDAHYREEAPVHRVQVEGFWIDRGPVTNREFARFVEQTGHVTAAEQSPRAEDYPGALPELLVPASVVFRAPGRRVDPRNPYEWWAYVPGASWRHPRGSGSSVEDLTDHPVVQVAYEDALAYARWAGKDLPSEAEWELAARGGLDGAEYVWGDEWTPQGRFMANTWQGEFPYRNTAEDGFEWTSPVGAFPENGFGLLDMAGNVWEWTSDWYQVHGRALRACCGRRNPRGGPEAGSHDERSMGPQIPRKVIKGGSHLCAPSYCRRYRPAARMAQPIDTATCHVGFRCVSRV